MVSASSISTQTYVLTQEIAPTITCLPQSQLMPLGRPQRGTTTQTCTAHVSLQRDSLGLCLSISPHRHPLATRRHEAVPEGPSPILAHEPAASGEPAQRFLAPSPRCSEWVTVPGISAASVTKRVSENGHEPTPGSRSFAQDRVRRGTRPPAKGKKRSQTRGSPK